MKFNSMSQEKLKSIAERCSEKVKSSKEGVLFFNEPFKHVIIDNFFPNEFASMLLEKFPDIDSDIWERTNDKDIEVKLRTKWKSEFDIPDGIIDAVRILNSSQFLHSMSELFNIEKIMPDPYFSGGGLNVTVSGGLLDVHVDGNYHDASGLNRRLNAIVYLNPNWQEGWGGEFGLYDATGDTLIKKVAPLHNRLVIFDTNDYSFHGLPDPLNSPQDEVRKSIILYYYTKEPRPSFQISVEEPHSALWKKRGLLDKRGNKTRESY
jgi:Rps23 Pro-64 3,4-dihydroxylase Tpa1-like proline 4-hydroxylase